MVERCSHIPDDPSSNPARGWEYFFRYENDAVVIKPKSSWSALRERSDIDMIVLRPSNGIKGG